jgi:hypothetical protein
MLVVYQRVIGTRTGRLYIRETYLHRTKQGSEVQIQRANRNSREKEQGRDKS